jgi:hypothetical protein
MTWYPDTAGAIGATELMRRIQSMLMQLETGDYAAATDAMRHWADEGELHGVPDEVVSRIRICIMDARAELIHMEPNAAQAQLRQALALTAIPA